MPFFGIIRDSTKKSTRDTPRMANFLNGVLFISEIMADNAGANAVDVDGDGVANKADEFVEIQNAGGGPVSLDGYML